MLMTQEKEIAKENNLPKTMISHLPTTEGKTLQKNSQSLYKLDSAN
jgi:hypothetical protein